MAYQSTNPYDGKVVKSFDDINDAQLEEKLKVAAHCFESDWRHRSYADRKKVLARAAQRGSTVSSSPIASTPVSAA